MHAAFFLINTFNHSSGTSTDPASFPPLANQPKHANRKRLSKSITIAHGHVIEPNLVQKLINLCNSMASLQFLSNASYWQYKDDTSYVLKWIDQTAKACGWKRQKTQQMTPVSFKSSPQSQSSNKDGNLPTNAPTGTKLAPTSRRLKGKHRKAAKKQAEEEAAAKLEKEKRDEDERGIVLSALEILQQANLISTCLPMSQSTLLRPPPSV